MLKHSLVDNPLTQDTDDCRAQVQEYRYKRIEDIVSQLTVSGSILKPTECVAVINGFFKTLAVNLEEGIGFESDYLTLTHSIAGVFTDKSDRFDPARHRVKLNLRAGESLKDALRRVKVHKVKAIPALPEIETVYDWSSRTTNQTLTPGSSVDVGGELLKVTDQENSEQGVFLVNTQKIEKIRIAYLHQNTAKKLQLSLPNTLKTGNSYKLEVRTTINGGQEVRTGVSAFTLQVK